MRRYQFIFLFSLHLSTGSSQPLNSNLTDCKYTNVGSFLHVTDIHVDENYVQGASLESLCHRKGKDTVLEVGKYGALGSDCDSPIALVEESYQFMHTNFSTNIDFVIDTGDVVRHDRDDSRPRTKEDVLSDHTRVVGYYQKYFDLTRVQIIPTIGNNDAYKHDELKEGSGLLEKLADIWEPYNLNLKQNAEFLNGGYFKVKLVPNKLDVISLNTLAWYTKNKKGNDCDQDGLAKTQLKWLETQLQTSQSQSQAVYLIGHIPPNDKKGVPLYYPKCYQKYLNLVGKYYQTVQAQFHGHTNSDTLAILVESKPNEFQLVTLPKKPPQLTFASNQIKSILTNGPSIIPSNNPALRLYAYDRLDNGKLLNYYQYYADLNKANVDGKLKFELEYDMAITYSLKDLSLTSWKEFIPRLLNPNFKLYDTYARFVDVNLH